MQQWFGRRVQPFLGGGRQQRGFQQRPQRRQPGVFVLQRHHRGEVVQGEVARVLDAQAEQLLRQQRGVGAGHAAFDQVAFERVADLRRDLREAFLREGLSEDDVDLVMRDFHLTLNA